MTKLAGCRIMIVEDEYDLAKNLKQKPQAEGAHVLGPFPRTASALAALGADGPDCAIIDVNLGGGADFDPANDLEARGIPFLFFPGDDREVIPDRFAGVIRLETPVDTARLVHAAEAICRPR